MRDEHMSQTRVAKTNTIQRAPSAGQKKARGPEALELVKTASQSRREMISRLAAGLNVLQGRSRSPVWLNREKKVANRV